MPKRVRSIRKSSRRGFASRRRTNNINLISIPFASSFSVTTAGSKQITAGDLSLDYSRPLRLRSLHGSFVIISDGSASCSLTVTLVADGQEGTVSRPHLITVYPQQFHLRQSRAMDFGQYGSGGSLVVIIYNQAITVTGTTAVKVCFTGKAVVEYQQSESIRMVKLYEHDSDSDHAFEEIDAMHLTPA